MYQMSKTLCPEALLEELENRLVIFVKSPRVQTDLCSESNIKGILPVILTKDSKLILLFMLISSWEAGQRNQRHQFNTGISKC